MQIYKVDLKGFDDDAYRTLGGRLNSVLDTFSLLKKEGFWVEIVTLLVPGFNDAEAQLRGMTKFIAAVSPDIPWHVTAFHSDYHMQETPNTPAKTLLRAADIGREAGLRYVYAGNLPGRVDEYENTFCLKCRATLVERTGYFIRAVRVTKEGKCHKCGERVSGVWG